MKYEEIAATVSELNQEIFSKTNGVEWLRFEYFTDGTASRVMFLGEQIWNDEDDMREYLDEKEDEFEPLETFLKREVAEIASILSTVFQKP